MSMKIIFGTCKIPKEAVSLAREVGYSIFDTATGYGNATDIGQVLDEKVGLIVKFNPSDFKTDIKETVEKHLKELKVSPSIVLLHSPLESDSVNLVGLAKLKELIPGKLYGISNFSISQVKYLIDNGFKPDIISLEFSPFYQPNKLVKYCLDNGILVTGYRPTYKGKVFEDWIIRGIAKKHGVSVSQVILKWISGKRIVPIVSSTKKENMIDNLDFDKVKLDSGDCEKLDKLNTNIATCMTKFCLHD
jgi:diketogulonate reductase-like aldo/keto reductase